MRCLIAIALALVAVPALAEDQNFPAERFRPSLTKDGVLDVEWGGVAEHLQWDAALWANYALNPLVVVDENDRVGALIAHRVGANLTGSIGLFDWVELAADVPLLLFQTRDPDGLPAAVGAAADVSAVGLGDLRLSPKVRLLRAKEQFIDLAVMPAVTIPTGVPSGASYVGEGQFTFVPEVAVSRALDVGGQGALRLATNLGYRVRPTPIEVLNVNIGHELLYRAGVGYRLHDLGVPLEVDATLAGSTYAFAPFTAAEESPLEVKGGVKFDVFAVPAAKGAGDDFFFQAFAGAGTGLVNGFGTPDLRVLGGIRLAAATDIDHDDDFIKDADDKCPDVAEDKDAFEDQDGCVDADNDGDGIEDDKDSCRNEAEDKDGHKDEDGCPDPDNDGDGVNDVDDGCKDVAEDKDGFADTDGCVDEDNDQDGVKDGADGCKDVFGPQENGGCPWPDTDGDGLTDNVDACKDKAGLKANAGCPDSDNDGFTDDKDKCPNEAETVNNIDDDDGCPDKGKVLVSLTKDKIEILDKVFFDTGKATIKPISFPLLQQVATVLKSHKEIAHIRVEGHTDSDGNADKNKALSQDRANAVKQWLIDNGVDAARLDAAGFGPDRPIADNATKAGKEQNRRVEFVIVPDGGVDAVR